jgi:hypothetical protein
MTRHRCRLLLDGSVPADFEGLGVLHVENVLAEWRIHELGVAVGERERKKREPWGSCRTGTAFRSGEPLFIRYPMVAERTIGWRGKVAGTAEADNPPRARASRT